MQWDATRAAGFIPSGAPAAATPWLPLSPDYTTVNAGAQAVNATSTLSLFCEAASARRAEPALRGAPLVPLDWAGSDAVPAGVVAFARPLRCACGNVTRGAASASPNDDQQEDSSDDYESARCVPTIAPHRLTLQPAGELPGQAPSPAPAPPAPDAPSQPRFVNETSFVFALNMAPVPVVLNLRDAMGRAGLGDDGWASDVALVLDSDDVAARAGQRVDAAALPLRPWQAVLLSVRLDAHA